MWWWSGWVMSYVPKVKREDMLYPDAVAVKCIAVISVNCCIVLFVCSDHQAVQSRMRYYVLYRNCQSQTTTTSGQILVSALIYAQNPLHTFPHNFPVDGEVANLLRTWPTSTQQVVVMEVGKRRDTTDFCPCQLVTVLRTCRLLRTCYGEVADLLWTCYGETGVMEFWHLVRLHIVCTCQEWHLTCLIILHSSIYQDLCIICLNLWSSVIQQ